MRTPNPWLSNGKKQKNLQQRHGPSQVASSSSHPPFQRAEGFSTRATCARAGSESRFNQASQESPNLFFDPSQGHSPAHPFQPAGPSPALLAVFGGSELALASRMEPWMRRTYCWISSVANVCEGQDPEGSIDRTLGRSFFLSPPPSRRMDAFFWGFPKRSIFLFRARCHGLRFRADPISHPGLGEREAALPRRTSPLRAFFLGPV